MQFCNRWIDAIVKFWNWMEGIDLYQQAKILIVGKLIEAISIKKGTQKRIHKD